MVVINISITALLTESAKQLLSTSARFEPFVPYSIKNTIQALYFLESLANLTQNSFDTKQIAPNPTCSLLSEPQTSHKIQDKLRDKTNDQKLIEALLRVRNSRPFFSRTSKILSPAQYRPLLTNGK